MDMLVYRKPYYECVDRFMPMHRGDKTPDLSTFMGNIVSQSWSTLGDSLSYMVKHNKVNSINCKSFVYHSKEQVFCVEFYYFTKLGSSLVRHGNMF